MSGGAKKKGKKSGGKKRGATIEDDDGDDLGFVPRSFDAAASEVRRMKKRTSMRE